MSSPEHDIFDRANVLRTVERDFPEAQQSQVLAELSRLDDESNWFCHGHPVVLAQCQLSILKLAAGDLAKVKRYVGGGADLRDLILSAGYA